MCHYFLPYSILGDPGADSGARESRNGQKKKWAKKSQGQNEKPLGKMFLQNIFKRSCPFWLQIGRRKLLYFSTQSASSKSVSCVLTQSCTRGSFARHVASLVQFIENRRLFFMVNLTVNVPQSLGTRRRICHVQVKSQFTGKFVPIERIILLFVITVLPLIRELKDHSILSV